METVEGLASFRVWAVLKKYPTKTSDQFTIGSNKTDATFGGREQEVKGALPWQANDHVSWDRNPFFTLPFPIGETVGLAGACHLSWNLWQDVACGPNGLPVLRA